MELFFESRSFLMSLIFPTKKSEKPHGRSERGSFEGRGEESALARSELATLCSCLEVEQSSILALK